MKRYEDLGDVVVDHATGLMWQKSGSKEELAYGDAQNYVNQLNQEQFAGYSDWCLPTVDELASLLEPEKKLDDLYIDPVFDARQKWCWIADIASLGSACYVNFISGRVIPYNLDNVNYVRAVRSRQ